MTTLPLMLAKTATSLIVSFAPATSPIADFNDDGVFDAVGGVHGAFSQVEPAGTIWGSLAATGNPTAWSRLMLQSVTTGDAVSLDLGSGGLPAPAPAPTGRGSR